MDRNNDFLFSGLKGSKDNQKKVLQKIKDEKEQIKSNKEKEDKAWIVQKYLRGYLGRRTLH